MKAALLVTVCCLFSILAKASDPYIELAQPSDLMEVHVNSSQYNPTGKKITKTEILFGDGTVITNNSDVYHQYSAVGNYNITVNVWPLQGSVQTFSKTVDLNPQYRIFSIANSVVFTNDSPKQNQTYSFQAPAAPENRLYKIKLTRRTDVSEPVSTESGSHGRCALGVAVNGIPLFKDNEINCNTTSIEKLVYLKISNGIVYDGPGRKLFSTEISAVELVKDYTAPIITSSLSSGTITNESKTHISIVDDSNATTYVWDQHQNLIFSTEEKSFDVSLNDGLNNFVIQSKDQYNNTSSYFYLTNITRDSTPASLNTILNSEYIYSTYPQDFTLTIYSDEDLRSLTINGALAFQTGPRTYSYVLNIAQPGQVDINLHAIDLAGNETDKTYSPIFSIDNIAPTITTNLLSNVVTSQNSVHVSIVDNATVITEIYRNGILIKTTSEKEFDIPFESQGFASFVIKSRDAYNNEAIDLQFDVTFDSIAPQATSLMPAEGTVIRTNQLPINIPIEVEFNESVATVSVNSVSAAVISPTKATAQISVQSAGPVNVRIEGTDVAGNSTVIERTVTVEYSNIPPVLTLDTSVRNMLTNDTEIRIFGTSNFRLAAATLNGASISVSDDGLSFSGIFSPPADGRYRIDVVGTDLYGNTGLVAGHVRVLVDLPEVFENYPTLTVTPTEIGHRINYGAGFSGTNLGDNCEALKNIFTQKEEFAASLQQIQKREDQILDQFPDGYEPDIPTTDSLMGFIGDIDEPLNYVKAGYLAVCEGKIIMPETDCTKNREVFKLLTGQYPEPMLIRSIPFIAPFIQDFLISRYNICTGLDTSGLSCEDMKRLLPLVANLTFPSVGQMMSSPVGQFVMDELMCKEICELPTYKDSPVCKQPPLPPIPEFSIETPISFMSPNENFPGVDLGQDDWGGGGSGGGSGGSGGGGSGGSGGHGGGGGGGSCGGWFSDCDDDGDGVLLCSVFPEIFFCSSGVPEISNQATYDPNVLCPDDNWTFADAINVGSPTNYLFSILSKCKKTSVSAVPKLVQPVITVTAPISNQEVSNTIRVKGVVDDAHAYVRVNGVDIKTISGFQGAYFDTIISTPTSMTVVVEAVNDWGVRAASVSILLKKSAPKYKYVERGFTHTCGITIEGALKCWSLNTYGRPSYLGDGKVGYSATPVQVLGMESDVSSVTSGIGYVCAIKNSALYCWGWNLEGALGIGTYTDQAIPVMVLGLESGVKTVSAKGGHVCALKYDGSVYCWGPSYNGQLGIGPVNGNYDRRATPQLVYGAGSGIDFLQVGPANTCIRKQGETYCWGYNYNQNLGVVSTDVTVMSPSKVTAVGIGMMDSHPNNFNTCGIQNGGVYCWGTNTDGGMGNGRVEFSVVEYRTAVVVPGFETGVTSLRSGILGRCALKGGRLYCWGSLFGATPIDMGLADVSSFAIGYRSICALSNNEITCIDR